MSLVHILVVGIIVNMATIFVIFAPPAHKVFHPECSITFSPDLTVEQKRLCRK